MPEGDSNTRCWRVRWTRPSIVARPKQAPYAKSSSSSEEPPGDNERQGEAMRDADGPLEPGSLRTRTLAFSTTSTN